MRSNQIPPVPEIWPSPIVGRLANADGVLIGLDFDGTLAPIAANPDEPTITPACQRAVKKFVAHPHALVTVISGRELSDLYERIGIPGVVYAGNHGLELCYGAYSEIHPVAEDHRTAVRRVLDRLPDRLTGIPGWELEDKKLTATIHVRRTPPWRVDEVRSAIMESIRETGTDLRVVSGKQVFEVRPAVDWDKGSTIEWLSRFTPERWRSVYLGDDSTDEDVFQAIRPDGVGIHVGSRVSTAAPVRLPDQTKVAPFLHWLAEETLDTSDTRIG